MYVRNLQNNLLDFHLMVIKFSGNNFSRFEPAGILIPDEINQLYCTL